MKSSRGGTAGVSRAQQHSDIIDVCSGAPVTTGPALDFTRPHGATPFVVELQPFLEHESETRAHLLQLVIDAASVPETDRPRGLNGHIARLWRAVEQLMFTGSPSQHRRLVADPAADTRRQSAEKFLALVDAGDLEARMIPVERLRDVVAVVDRFLNIDSGRDARRGLELVRAELVALVTP